MKAIPAALLIGALLCFAGCATSRPLVLASPTEVEASCGQCLLGLEGEGCDLAVRIKGHSYFVDGVHLDSLGDAHAADGMCEVIRQARVTGEVKKGRFVASSIELLPSASGK